MEKYNAVLVKSEAFAIRIGRMYQYLKTKSTDFNALSQVLRSGTSIGANTAEAVCAQSRADFYSKLKIAQKESMETAFWLKYLFGTGSLNEREFQSIFADCQELIKILISITRTINES